MFTLKHFFFPWTAMAVLLFVGFGLDAGFTRVWADFWPYVGTCVLIAWFPAMLWRVGAGEWAAVDALATKEQRQKQEPSYDW